MTDNRPRSSDRKLSLIPPLTLAAGLAALVIAALLFRAGGKHETPAPPAEAPPPAAPPPAQVSSEAVFNRTELIKEANAIAAAYAAGGQRPSQGKDPLAGRRFAVKIPFGCDGPQPRGGSAQAFYEFNPDNRTVRLVARPATWTNLPLIQELPKPGKIEAVEGFWIPHRWSYAESCPPPREQPLPAAPTSAAAQTLGLAQLFETGGSRVLRRGDRPYETLVKLAKDDEPPAWRGYRLLLEGRFTTYPDGRVARCWSESNDHQPVCLYAVQFDRVAFEGPADGKVLAEWRE